MDGGDERQSLLDGAESFAGESTTVMNDNLVSDASLENSGLPRTGGHALAGENAYSDGPCLLKTHPVQQQQEDRSAERLLYVVAMLSALFIVCEFIGGIWANSLAILTDAGHMLSDCLSFVLSIAMIRLSRKPANSRFTFGYLRAEVFGALMSVFIIWTLTVVLIVLATQRAVSREVEVSADPMLLTAVLSLLFNVVVACILRWGGGSGQHHQHNFNVRAALIHVIGDFLQSIGVIVASVLIKYTHLMIIDPLCTYLFSIFVLATSMSVFKDILFVLMEATPDSTDYPKLHHELISIDGIKGVHSLHAWSLGSNTTAASVHIISDEAIRSTGMITQRVNQVLKRILNASFITVQVESGPNNEIT